MFDFISISRCVGFHPDNVVHITDVYTRITVYFLTHN